MLQATAPYGPTKAIVKAQEETAKKIWDLKDAFLDELLKKVLRLRVQIRNSHPRDWAATRQIF